MKDFPMFTTEYGVASLVLKEVPYRQEAYITLRSTQEPDKLLEECVSFCRMVGAEKIYARGHEYVTRYPLHCAVLEMSGCIPADESQVAHLWPVDPENIARWRSLLNEKMAPVDNAGTLDRAGEREILELGGAYFVHRSGELLGAGWLADGELKLVAAFRKGAGAQVVHTLLTLADTESVKLRVASTNHRAIRLYERLGFVKTGEVSRWYRVY